MYKDNKMLQKSTQKSLSSELSRSHELKKKSGTMTKLKSLPNTGRVISPETMAIKKLAQNGGDLKMKATKEQEQLKKKKLAQEVKSLNGYKLLKTENARKLEMLAKQKTQPNLERLQKTGMSSPKSNKSLKWGEKSTKLKRTPPKNGPEQPMVVVQVDETQLCDDGGLELGTLAQKATVRPPKTSPMQFDIVQTKPTKPQKPSKIPISHNFNSERDFTKKMDKLLRIIQGQVDRMKVSLEGTGSEAADDELEKEKEQLLRELKSDCNMTNYKNDVTQKPLNKAETDIFNDVKATTTTTLVKKEMSSGSMKCMQRLKNNEMQQTLAEMKKIHCQQHKHKQQQTSQQQQHLKTSIITDNVNANNVFESVTKSVLNFPMPTTVTLKSPLSNAWNEASIKPKWSGLLREKSYMHETSVISNDVWYSPRGELPNRRLEHSKNGGALNAEDDDDDDVFVEFADCMPTLSKTSSDLD